MPSKRFPRKPIEYLRRPEMKALLDAPDLRSWIGRRDRALLLVALRTGLRVSEFVALRWDDVTLGEGAHVRCEGKGRKTRCTPLDKEARGVLHKWKAENESRDGAIVFPSLRGGPLSRDGVQRILDKHVAVDRTGRGFTTSPERPRTPDVQAHG